MSSSAKEQPDDLPVPAASPSPLILPRRTLNLLNYATHQELNPDDRELAFSARVFAQVSLPYRDPGDAAFWERKNGPITLTVRPALLTKPDGSRYTAFPCGLIPRQTLTWMATEAFNTKSPELELGKSMTAFMRKIDLAHNGQNAGRLTDNLRRLFGSQMSVEGLAATDAGHGSVTQYFQIADAVQLWFPTGMDNENNPGLWSSRVTLSDQFFQSIMEAPVPLDMLAMRALGSSPMRLDLLLWLGYRMSYLKDTTRVTWAQLDAQFGSQYKRLRAFKNALLKNLKDVLIVYPELNVEVTDDYLILRRSPTHVPQLPGAHRSKLRLVGDKFPQIDPG